jgi:hypothetical protein
MTMDQETRELLIDLKEAFEAIPIAAKARKVLKKIGQSPGTYAGNGSHILARHYAGVIDRILSGVLSQEGGIK